MLIHLNLHRINFVGGILINIPIVLRNTFCDFNLHLYCYIRTIEHGLVLFIIYCTTFL